MRGRRLPSVLALLAVLALAGCGQRAEPVGELEQPYPVRVEGAGDRPTVLKERPARIVVLDPGSAELLAALPVGERLVGVPVGISGGEALVRPTGQIDVEAVVRLDPDLIVATLENDQVDVSRAERESGAALYVQPSSSIEDVERAALQVGFLVGEPVAARRLRAEIRAAVGAVDARLADVGPITVFVDTGFFITVPGSSLLADLVRRAGGESVAGPSPGPEPFDLEELLRLDPEVYLTTSGSGVTLEKLLKDPQARRLRAIKEGRFAVLPEDLVTRAGPRVAQALEAVARALHPDAFR